MKIIKTELVYVPKDLCNSASYWMSINDKDTKINMIIPMMIDCFSIVRLPYLNLNVMFYEVDCMTFSNNCTRQLVSTVLRKNPIERKKLTNYIYYRCSPHVRYNLSDHRVPSKSERAYQYDLTSILWHDIIAIINRFENRNRRWVVMWSVEHCDLYVRNCSDGEIKRLFIVIHSSCNKSGELEAITTDNHIRRTRNYYQRVYFVGILKYARSTNTTKVKTQ
ncbi:hypothetical protein LCGC14_1245150 [marine sediment metagenome]|uniref:Uncharacterized protein n=1 Tax=marine sediment metagenome TaxID=412755 RepID=A0A0F9P8S8_9ZZZZ